ncbi:hypothetical protein FGB62_21g215 [Gracilaria domingensis]|nr:hypothetical protein FGB62_21g215 [Gracilaria domingensis]
MDTDWRTFEVDREDLHLEDTQTLTIVTVARIPSRSYPNSVESQLVLLYSHGTTLHGCCTCDRSSSDGLPCSHITRISTVYNDICQRWPDIASVVGHRFRLEDLFHPYWFRESSSWCIEDILSLRSKMGAIGVQVLGEIEDLRRSPVQNETTANRLEELLNGRTLDQYLEEIHEE